MPGHYYCFSQTLEVSLLCFQPAGNERANKSCFGVAGRGGQVSNGRCPSSDLPGPELPYSSQQLEREEKPTVNEANVKGLAIVYKIAVKNER